MLRKLGISLIAVALVAVMSFGVVSASAGAGDTATASKATAKSKAKKAAKQARKACAKVKKANGKAAKKKAAKKCKAAKKKAAKLAKAAKTRTITVCAHGCDSRTIQGGIDRVLKKSKIPASRTTIAIKPGTYVEGARVGDKFDPAFSHKFDGLTIKGTGKNPGKVIVEGTNAKDPEGNPAAQGIETVNVSHMTVENLWVRNFQNNGVFIHGSPDPDFESGFAPVDGKYPTSECHGYLMKNIWVSFNRSYGLFAFDCIGGRMTGSKGWGHGDSAWYIGQTPPQKKPVWSSIDNSRAYENVLGYSGTNSRYVNIHDNEFLNNGVGIVPNTLDSERYWPTGDGIIEKNKIYWNNFNYFLRKSSVQTVSNGLGPNPLGPGVLNYPTGVGVALFGGNGWKVRNNDVFGNWEWGVATFSDPFTTVDGQLIGMSQNNQITNNRMGKNGADLNGHDFLSDGSGLANCYQGNTNTSGVSFAEGGPGDGGYSHADLYPACPGTGVGSAQGVGDPVNQLQTLLGHVSMNPPWEQQCDWTVNPHEAISGRTPLNVEMTPDPAFPTDPEKSEDMALCPS